MKIHTNGTQVFSLQNSDFTAAVLAVLRKGLNKKYRMIVRGRAKDRKAKGGCQDTQPLDGADWLAVYIEPANPVDRFWEGHKAGRVAALRDAADAILKVSA